MVLKSVIRQLPVCWKRSNPTIPFSLTFVRILKNTRDNKQKPFMDDCRLNDLESQPHSNVKSL